VKSGLRTLENIEVLTFPQSYVIICKTTGEHKMSKKYHIVGEFQASIKSNLTYEDMFEIQAKLEIITDNDKRAAFTDSGSAMGPGVPPNRDLAFDFKGSKSDAQSLANQLNDILKSQSGITGKFTVENSFDYQENIVNNPLMQ